jgi:predicted dehydrogenase
MQRRTFLATTALAFPAVLLGQTPSRRLRVAVVGTAGRGTSHAVELSKLADVEVSHICDVDDAHAAAAASAVEKRGFKRPATLRDFRAALEDRSVDAITIATPNHWHTPAALLAITAGKHVYVEKPCSHNPHEGELLVAAARKYNKHVQHGTQRRSWTGLQEAVQRLRSGELGRLLSARAYYFNSRPTIGKGMAGPVPAGLDWSLWQGPAPEREFRTNYVHYNWHWFWHWGNGELGNNGVHMLDVARWGLGVTCPKRVVSAGAKVRFPDDDQETPDTNTVTFDFVNDHGPLTVTWENRSWNNRTAADPKHDVAFFGEKGTLFVQGGGYSIQDLKGAEIAKGTGPAGDTAHFQNFVDTVRGDAKLNAEIEEGHLSTLLCHLGNIAWRTSGAVQVDPTRKRLAPVSPGGNGPAAEQLWQREYRAGWEPRI